MVVKIYIGMVGTGIGKLVCITGLFLELSLKRNGCGLLDMTVSGKKLCIKTHDKKVIVEKVPPCLALC